MILFFKFLWKSDWSKWSILGASSGRRQRKVCWSTIDVVIQNGKHVERSGCITLIFPQLTKLAYLAFFFLVLSERNTNLMNFRLSSVLRATRWTRCKRNEAIRLALIFRLAPDPANMFCSTFGKVKLLIWQCFYNYSIFLFFKKNKKIESKDIMIALVSWTKKKKKEVKLITFCFFFSFFFFFFFFFLKKFRYWFDWEINSCCCTIWSSGKYFELAIFWCF